MKKSIFLIPLAIIALAELLPSCGFDRVPPEATGYPDSVAQIITLKCLNEGCHNAQDTASGLSLENWADAMKGSNWGEVIVPYNASHSHLFQHINSFSDLGPEATPAMPSAANRLSRTEVLAIMNWINAGARSGDSTYYWQSQESSKTGKMFVECQGEDLLAVVDLQSNLVMRMVSVGQNPDNTTPEAPHNIVPSPDSQYIYVSLVAAGVLERYRADNYQFVDRVSLGRNSEASIIRLSPDGSRAVVSLFGAGSDDKLLLINTQTMQILDRLSGSGICEQAHGIAPTADFRTLWVTAWAGNYVTKVELAADLNSFVNFDQVVLQEGSSVPQANSALEPYWSVLSPDEGTLYVSCSKTNEIVKVNTATMTVTGRVKTGKFPRQFVLDGANNRLFVSCKSEENFAEQGSLFGCVSVIDIANGNFAFSQNIYRVGQNPHGIGLDYKNNRLRVTSENTTGSASGHHATSGGPPGFAHAINLSTLEVMKAEEIELAAYAASLYIAN